MQIYMFYKCSQKKCAMLSHIYATVAHFSLHTLQNVMKAVHNFLSTLKGFCTFAPCSPYGLSRKGKRAFFNMKSPVFSFTNENSCRFSLQFQRKSVPLQHPKIKLHDKSTIKETITHATVWQAETPQCSNFKHRTPTACLFFNILK